MGYRMTELQYLGVKVEAVGGTAVERVAYDGAVQSVGMGGVDTKLVSAACLGVEGDAGSVSRVILFIVIQRSIATKTSC